MNNLNIIDQFMQTFIRYIDSGFGLLNGDVVGLTSVLIGIDITLAGLFWALDHEGDVLARLIKKSSLYRCLCVHHRQFPEPCHHHLQFLLDAGAECYGDGPDRR